MSAQMSTTTAASTTAPATSGTTTSADPNDRATEFRAVEGGPEMRSGAQLLVTAYALIWLFLLAWLVIVWRKQNTLNGRIRDLEAALDKRAASSDAVDREDR